MPVVNLDECVLRLREGDDVGVLKKTVKGGTELATGELKLTLAGVIPGGHKIALKNAITTLVPVETVRKSQIRHVESRCCACFLLQSLRVRTQIIKMIVFNNGTFGVLHVHPQAEKKHVSIPPILCFVKN